MGFKSHKFRNIKIKNSRFVENWYFFALSLYFQRLFIFAELTKAVCTNQLVIIEIM